MDELWSAVFLDKRGRLSDIGSGKVSGGVRRRQCLKCRSVRLFTVTARGLVLGQEGFSGGKEAKRSRCDCEKVRSLGGLRRGSVEPSFFVPRAAPLSLPFRSVPSQPQLCKMEGVWV